MNKLSDRLSALTECAECNGKGYAEIIEHWERPCDACHGEGYVMTDTQETLREAVARAICENMTLGTGCTKHFYETADAAIATMFERLRTPSAGMQDAGYDCLWDEDHRLPWESMNFIWQAMLTAFQQENSDAR